MIKQTTFKAGDKVYYPNRGTEIYKLEESNSLDFPLEIKNSSAWTIFRSNGRANSASNMVQLFHATEDNCYLLSKLYGIEFEKPKPTPTPRQVIEHRLARASFAPCLVGDGYGWDAMALIVRVKDGNDGAIEYIDGVGNKWYDAQLIDDSGCEIWEIEE